MFFLDGFVYGNNYNSKEVRIKDIKILKDRIMLLTFISGENRLFDASILNGKVYEPLENEEVFNSASIDHGVVCWLDGEIDCAPEYMYDNSYEYEPNVECKTD